jgi:hypothetical protein
MTGVTESRQALGGKVLTDLSYFASPISSRSAHASRHAPSSRSSTP